MSTRLRARIERLQQVMQPVGRILAMREDPSRGLAEQIAAYKVENRGPERDLLIILHSPQRTPDGVASHTAGSERPF
jgi:hypothetical protein